MFNYMFRPKAVVISFTQIVPNLRHIFDTNNSCYVHQVFNFVDDKIVDKLK
jgi:hypothetical protein